MSGRSTPPSAPTSREGSRTREPRQKEVEKPAEAVKEYTMDEIELKTRAIIDEFLHIQDKKVGGLELVFLFLFDTCQVLELGASIKNWERDVAPW